MQDFNERNYKKIGEFFEEFFNEYAVKDDSLSDEEFLKKTFARNLPKLSKDKIEIMCREIFESNHDMKIFLDEARKSPAYENATQNWFCEKIKQSLDKGDYDFVRMLFIENEILNMINQSSIQISNDFQNINSVHS